MRYEAEVSFFRRMMDNLHIDTSRFMPDEPPLLDVGMSALSEYAEMAGSVFGSARPRTIYIAQDAFMFSYAYLVLPDTGEILLVGPYLLEEIGDHAIMQMMESHGVSAARFQSMRKFIGNLTVMSSDKYLISVLCTLGEVLWGDAHAFEIERVNRHSVIYPISEAEVTANHSLMEAADFRVMEERYKTERQLMHFISQGHTHRAQMIVAQMRESTVERRVQDYLRNMKNYAIIFNTLARKAVEEGGVHPLHIDKLSSQMAQKIENVRTAEECQQLFMTMVHKYCLLVKNHSMKSYSLLIQHVILRIESDLTADLSLKAHAEALSVNASYLSTLFKKETGQTLTEYVSRKRMDHAIFLLNSTDMQVQTIAQYCGISDVNYFTKTFKRIVGKTPKEYRVEARSEK